MSHAPWRDGAVRLADVRLAYREWPGEKGPVLCLPGLTGHKGTFNRLAEHLSPEYHILSIDLRGRGDSDKPEDGYGFAYHTRDLLALADLWDWASFVLVGHSFGATLGVYLASVRPGRIRAAVLIDGGADPKDEVLEAMRPAYRRLGMSYPTIQALLEDMRGLPFHQPWNPALEMYFREGAEPTPDGGVRAKTSPHAIQRDLDLHFSYSMCVHFPSMTCPTLFLRPGLGLLGERGHILDRREAAAFVKWIPNARQVDIPGVNHYTMILNERPPIVGPIRSFLAEVLPEPASARAS
ncbi:MAG TPA: alpha/beta hydrolase [Anaerolineales bacterium]|nr:alpha/beta hydrolase [Anaerolineales bacterium]